MSGIATEILNLRRNQGSSVEILLGTLEWVRAASRQHSLTTRAYEEAAHSVAREYAATEAADIVLLNVAIHAAAAEAFFTQPPQKARRASAIWRRVRRGRDNRDTRAKRRESRF
jgi:hypothetical protein